MNKIKNFIIVATIALFGATAYVAPASAIDVNTVVATTSCDANTSAKDCAMQGLNSISNGQNTNIDLPSKVKTILSTVFFVLGIVAVVMIILGGFNYMLSQGDSGKVKKGKDTILYGIVGLIICLIANAIVTFVLNAMA